MTTMLSLSNEIITRIGDYLPDTDLAHLVQANQYLNQILSRSLLQRALEEQPPPVVKIHALLWAIHYGHTSLVKTILSQPNFTRYCGGIYDALYLAAELGHAEMIPLLIAAGYSVQGDYAKSPLHIAALGGHASVVAVLLDHGADILKKDSKGRTVLLCAIEAPGIVWTKMAPKRISEDDKIALIKLIEAKAVDTIEVLLARGAHVQVRMADERGNTPLHHAAFRCLDSASDLRVGTGILHLLVQAGASLTARNENHLTPFELVVEYSTHCPTAVTFFLDIGLSPNTKDYTGASLLSNTVLCDEGAFRVMEVLLDRGANAEDIELWDLFHDAQDPDPVLFDKMLNLLLINGATFDDKTASECFSYAAMFGMLDVMKVVLETHPVDINTRVSENGGSREGTPLSLAISDQRADILEYLVKHGVRMSTQEKQEVAGILGEEK